MTTLPQEDILALAADFILTLQNRTSFHDLLRFYHPDVEQIEFPNTLSRNTVVRTLADLESASAKGMTVLQKEVYNITQSYCIGNTVIIEATWTGTLGMPMGDIPIGGEMKANFAQFFEFKDGKIIRQRNYDCFQPFI
ncbi:MAG: nuclear transport factor 2 family protein [Bacteroidota bacterium]